MTPRLDPAPSPDTFDLMMDDLIAEARQAKTEYRWLYPSGYAKGRKGSTEKVRHGVSGAGGDLSDVVAGGDPEKENSETLTNRVKRHLEQAGDHGRKALAHMKGAGTANSRAQEDIDRAAKPTLVALDPLEPALADKPFTPDHLRGMTPTEARSQQGKRNARVSRTGAERRRRQDVLTAAVVRRARRLVDEMVKEDPIGAEPPSLTDVALATLSEAILDLDIEATESVSTPWASEERVG